MNVVAIRAAIKGAAGKYAAEDFANAVVIVALRACDEWDAPCECSVNGVKKGSHTKLKTQLKLIADILREAGVEVEA